MYTFTLFSFNIGVLKKTKLGTGDSQGAVKGCYLAIFVATISLRQYFL